MIGGALIRGGRAAAGLRRITRARGERYEGGNRQALEDEFFHIWDCCMVGLFTL
jgi:hypothetical protein